MNLTSLHSIVSSWFPDWVIGVLLSFGGCALTNFGINMFKLAHIRIAEEEARAREVAAEWSDTSKSASDESSRPINRNESTTQPTERNVACHPVWLLGAVCVSLGSILDLVAFAFASISLLAPLGAMTLVLNMFMAPLFLKEKLTAYDVKCTLVILIGTIVAISFGNKSNPSYTLHQLLGLYSQLSFLIYVGIFLAILIVSIIFVLRSHYRLDHPAGHDEDTLHRDHRYVLIFYPSMAGIVGAHSVLLAKSVIEMVKSAASGRSPGDVKSALFFIFLFGAFFAIYLQCYFLNKGLARGDALFIVPVYQVAWVLMNTLLGMIYFRDYIQMSALAIGLFCVGVSVTLLGVYLLSLREKAPMVGQSLAKQVDSASSGDGSDASEGAVSSANKAEALAVDKIITIVSPPADSAASDSKRD